MIRGQLALKEPISKIKHCAKGRNVNTIDPTKKMFTNFSLKHKGWEINFNFCTKFIYANKQICCKDFIQQTHYDRLICIT